MGRGKSKKRKQPEFTSDGNALDVSLQSVETISNNTNKLHEPTIADPRLQLAKANMDSALQIKENCAEMSGRQKKLKGANICPSSQGNDNLNHSLVKMHGDVSEEQYPETMLLETETISTDEHKVHPPTFRSVQNPDSPPYGSLDMVFETADNHAEVSLAQDIDNTRKRKKSKRNRAGDDRKSSNTDAMPVEDGGLVEEHGDATGEKFHESTLRKSETASAIKHKVHPPTFQRVQNPDLSNESLGRVSQIAECHTETSLTQEIMEKKRRNKKKKKKKKKNKTDNVPNGSLGTVSEPADSHAETSMAQETTKKKRKRKRNKTEGNHESSNTDAKSVEVVGLCYPDATDSKQFEISSSEILEPDSMASEKNLEVPLSDSLTVAESKSLPNDANIRAVIERDMSTDICMTSVDGRNLKTYHRKGKKLYCSQVNDLEASRNEHPSASLQLVSVNPGESAVALVGKKANVKDEDELHLDKRVESESGVLVEQNLEPLQRFSSVSTLPKVKEAGPVSSEVVHKSSLVIPEVVTPFVSGGNNHVVSSGDYSKAKVVLSPSAEYVFEDGTINKEDDPWEIFSKEDCSSFSCSEKRTSFKKRKRSREEKVKPTADKGTVSDDIPVSSPKNLQNPEVCDHNYNDLVLERSSNFGGQRPEMDESSVFDEENLQRSFSKCHVEVKLPSDVDAILLGVPNKEDSLLERSSISPKSVAVSSTMRKLLILDLNGLLADIVTFVPKGYKADKMISKKALFKRPFCDDFLKFCFERFDVGVWSSRTKYNVDSVVNFLMGEMKHKLLFCWDQSHCTKTGFTTIENSHKPLVLKELKKLWDKSEPSLPWRKGEYNESNTLLLDDSPYKALRNPPYTALFPHSYTFQDKDDTSLGPGGDLRVYLEGLATAENVQKYVEAHPFGQRAITSSNPSWSFYLKGSFFDSAWITINRQLWAAVETDAAVYAQAELESAFQY